MWNTNGIASPISNHSRQQGFCKIRATEYRLKDIGNSIELLYFGRSKAKVTAKQAAVILMPVLRKAPNVTCKLMDTPRDIKDKILREGFATIDNVFSSTEVNSLIDTISNVDTNKDTFRKSSDLFAIRQFLKEIPKTKELIFSTKLTDLISQVFGDDYFVVKSIYFDKPEQSNWFVAYHQDITISVDRKLNLPGFGPWTVKQNQFAVQPPIDILQNNFTIRIHLDDTNEDNGALKVVPKSHLKGIYRPETIDWTVEQDVSCNVAKGGVMIMRPLLLHASGRTTNNLKRRVIHIEFSNQMLPHELQWSELCRYQQACT